MRTLNYGMKVMKQVIDISPQPSNVIDKYRGTDFIYNSSYNNNETIIQKLIVTARFWV